MIPKHKRGMMPPFQSELLYIFLKTKKRVPQAKTRQEYQICCFIKSVQHYKSAFIAEFTLNETAQMICRHTPTHTPTDTPMRIFRHFIRFTKPLIFLHFFDCYSSIFLWFPGYLFLQVLFPAPEGPEIVEISGFFLCLRIWVLTACIRFLPVKWR